MSQRAVSFLCAVLLLCAATFASGQEATRTTTVQNPDGSFTVIEYPVGKEVQVMLTPVGIASDGIATILRDDAGTRIKLNLNKLPGDLATIHLYAVDDRGVVTSLGPVAIANGIATYSGITPLSKFMLIASPEANLTTYDPNTKIFFRSAVPQGFAVVPRVVNPEGEKVAASATSVTVPASTYTVPMLNIPAFKKGDDTKMKVNFKGPLTGARANIFITPRKDGPTEVKVRFHELKEAPTGKIYEVWAVSPDNQFVKLGQIVNAPGRNEAEVKAETTLTDFGLLITMEDASGNIASPHGDAIGVVEIIK